MIISKLNACANKGNIEEISCLPMPLFVAHGKENTSFCVQPTKAELSSYNLASIVAFTIFLAVTSAE